MRRIFAAIGFVLTTAASAEAQAGGFVYALQDINGSPNQIHGFAVNAATGALTPLAGFPVAAGGNGPGFPFEDELAYDAVNSRLYALNTGSRTIGAFAVDRFTGALSALPFSPLSLPAGAWACLDVSVDGSILATVDSTSKVATSFLVTGTSATLAPGGPVSTGSAAPYSCAFSQNGAYFYTGGNSGTVIAGFSVNASTAALTSLNGSPFPAGAGNPLGYASDASGRLFTVTLSDKNLRISTTSAGIPTTVGTAVASGLTSPTHGLLTSNSLYLVSDRTGNRVGAYRIAGTGSGTSLTAATSSPFATGGTFTDILKMDGTGTLLFAANATSRNITTFRVASTNPVLTSLSVQAANGVGSTGNITGLAFVPPISGGFVYALQQVNGGPNQIHGFSVNTTTGALTSLAGFPVASGGNGGGAFISEQLFYDRVNARLYAMNSGSSSVSAFAVNRATGALSALPFSPISLPTGTWTCLATNPNGTVLVAGSYSGLSSFVVTATSATSAGGQINTGSVLVGSCHFSLDGGYFYAGNLNGTTVIAEFSVNESTGVLTALAGSPFNTGMPAPTAVETDSTGRVFTTSRGNGTLRVYTSSSGILTPVTGNPFASGIVNAGSAVLAPSGHYIVGEYGGFLIGVLAIAASGSSTTATAVTGSPFAAGGLYPNLLLDDVGALLFAASGSSRSISTFSINPLTGALTSLAAQAINTLGTTGILTGVAFAPRAAASAAADFATAGTGPMGMTAGPDGNVWFTEFTANKIGRITPAGVMTEFDALATRPSSITKGADGNLWFASYGSNTISRMTPAGVVSGFGSGGGGPAGITSGPEGALWFTRFDDGLIGRLTTSGALTLFVGLTAGAKPVGITQGPDGNLWFTESGLNRIGRMTPLGIFTEFPISTASSNPQGIVAGPDGALWFTERTANKIGRITTAGVITEFGGISPGVAGITVGPDGNLWFSTDSKIGRITPSGAVTEYTPPNGPIDSPIFPAGLATGPDGNIWYAAYSVNKVGVFALSTFGISIVKGGTGMGTVSGGNGAVAPISCGTTCGAAFAAGALVTLSATPDTNSRFAGWSGGGCLGTAPCVMLVSRATAVTAAFTQQFTLTAVKAGTGTVTSSAGGISCGSACAAAYDTGTAVTLTAAAGVGFRFGGWSGGGCSGTSTCTVTMNAAATVTATFVQQVTLTITLSGNGTVTSDIGGISCGSACSAVYDTGTSVTLTAAPASGWTFSGWGLSACGTGPCTIVITSATTGIVSFSFSITPSSLSDGTVGVPYSQAFVASAGSAAFATLAVSLPPGLSLSGDGVLAGTPTSPGMYSFSVSATPSGSSLTRIVPYSLTIGCQAITVSPASLPVAVTGGAYSQAITQTGGIGATMFTVTAGALPDGLSLASTGALMGTPAQAGPFSFTVTASDSNGCTGSRAYTPTIAGLPSVALSGSTVNFGAVNNGAGTLTAQTPAQTIVLAQTGPGVVTWTAAADQPWITIAPSSGSVPGTLTISIQNAGGTLPVSGVLSGMITLTTAGAANNPAATVNLSIVTGEGTPPTGAFDTPADGQGGITGSVAVTGWAVDDIGATAVRIYRSPVTGENPGSLVFIGNGAFIAGARPDVAAAYAQKPYADRAGWGYLMLTNFLPAQGNGTFTLFAYAEDVEGKTALIGTKTITCTNATATLPFGAIDTPEQGGTASGNPYINFGWVLAAQPAASGLFMPFDGSTIQVYVDAVSIGTLTSYNNARPDIQALFPGYANTDGAVGVKFLDTTTLANGLHAIFWVAADNLGATAGIGSRFFNVSNAGAGLRAGLMAADAPLQAMRTGTWLTVTRGFAPDVMVEIVPPDADGVIRIHTRPLSRIAIGLGEGTSAVTPLPVGASLNGATGEFAWIPGVGFGGTHHLEFVRQANGRRENIRIDVVIDPSASPQ